MTFEEFIHARLPSLVRYATVVTWDPHLAVGTAFRQLWLVVDLGPGRFLTVLCSVDGPDPLIEQDIIRVAGHVEVDLRADVEWLGTR